jgi:2',3'-cyclic-nucleotide 2'-phosphodiesterase (5'-nucleotidase family)
MKRAFSFLFACALILSGITAVASAPDGAALTIIYSHDLHSHAEPRIVRIDGVDSEAGGFARLKALIDAAKGAHEATFVLDAGDFSMGALIQTVYRERAGELILMGLLGYDAVTIGNHELDYRDSGFAQMLETAAKSGGPLPQLVISNLTAPDEKVQRALDAYGAVPYAVIERGGVRMAVFGLLGANGLDTAPMTEFAWAPIADAAKRAVQQIKEEGDIDIIVALSHSGTGPDIKRSEDELLAKAVPEIDVIVSGHTHTFLPEPITVGNTHIVSQGEYGEHLSAISLARRPDGRWDIADSSHRPVGDDIEGNEIIETMIQGYIRDASELYLSAFGYNVNQVIAQNPLAFPPYSEIGAELREEPLGNLISDAYRYAAERAEGENREEIAMAMTAYGLVRGSLASGNVTAVDAFNIASTGMGADGTPGYPLISVYITGEELRTAAEVDVSVSMLMPDAQLYSSGVSWAYNPNRLILNRVTDVWIDKSGAREEIENDKLYRVVTSLYCAQMLSAVESKSYGLLAITPKNSDGSVMTDFEANIIHDAQGREIKEWSAIAGYLESMGTVSDYYGAVQGRKLSQPDSSVFALLKNPNKAGKIAIAAAALIILLIALSAYFIATRKRRRAKRRAATTA